MGSVLTMVGLSGSQRLAAKTKNKLQKPEEKREGDTDGWWCEAGETVSPVHQVEEVLDHSMGGGRHL